MTVEIDYSTTPETIPAPITGAVDGVYSYNEEHAAEAISHLISFFREGPRNQAVLEAMMAQVQELEDNIALQRDAFDVDTAVGDQLDSLGKRVGERRDDRIDDVYRTAIRVRILVNRSNGRLEELLAIALGISPAATIRARELYPAALSLEFSTLGTSTLQNAYRLLKKAKAAGVRLLVAGVGDDGSIGAVDADPLGGEIGAVDGSPAGFLISGGT